MAKRTEQFEVRNRWTGKVQFTAEITCGATMLPRLKLGLAVRWAYENGAVLRGAVLRDAVLRGAVLRDADLSDADLSDADLRDAVLSDADLSGADLSGADLSGAVLRGAVLRDADLSGADLSGAVLRDADLRDADLRGAPVIPNIHQAVYAAASQPDALDMGDWHRCETTHCRAGWVTTLAGEEGKKLEARMGTPAAATLIYLASDPKMDRFPNFYCSNAEALADMKRLAELEAASATA